MSITLNDGAATFYPYIYVIITSYARWMNSVTSEAICPAIKKNVRNVFSWKKIVEFDWKFPLNIMIVRRDPT